MPAGQRQSWTGWPGDRGPLVISAAWADLLYAQSPDRSSGIRIEKPDHGLSVPGAVTAYGTLRTTPAGERYIEAVELVPLSGEAPIALGMANIRLGGQDQAYDAQSGSGQRGVTGAIGLNNVGLLVRTWGRVGQVDSAPVPLWFEIDDGSGWNVQVVLPPAATAPNPGSLVAVTGPLSLKSEGASTLPRILLRSASDLTVLVP